MVLDIKLDLVRTLDRLNQTNSSSYFYNQEKNKELRKTGNFTQIQLFSNLMYFLFVIYQMIYHI